MKRRRARAIAIASILSLTLSVVVWKAQVASAYHLENIRWPNQPTTGCCLVLSFYIQPGISSSSTTAWNNGASAWNSSPANYLLESGCCDVHVDAQYNSNVSWDGITYIYFSSGNTVSYTYAYLNTYYTENHFSCGHWPFPDCYSNATRQSVAAHELGHSAGLDHTSSCVLMNPYTHGSGGRFTSDCGYIDAPKSDDINGVNAQY